MQTEQRHWMNQDWQLVGPKLNTEAQLVLVFGGTAALCDPALGRQLAEQYPKAVITGCSTAGEIMDTRVFDDTAIATAIGFEQSRIVSSHVAIGSAATAAELGAKLIETLDSTGLVHVFVLSDGLHVNGSELVRGMRTKLPAAVQVTGGLSGDGGRFQKTVVWAGGEPREGFVTAIGFYGSTLKVGFGSMGGWDPFGPDRMITRSEANVLYELDGKPALALYKTYLGDHVKDLPGSGLLFPLCVRAPDSKTELVRTVLALDEKTQSLTFAGDLPQGHIARLMKANFDRLVDGANGAATSAKLGGGTTELAVLISCVGRKMVLKQRTEEEIEAVREVVGSSATIAGFYSYGEICPSAPNASCELHNQTMTITTFSEH